MAKIADSQSEFYGRLWQEHGNDPRSLSWRDARTQFERFFRLARAFERAPDRFSVHEVGCGLGHFGDYLQTRFPKAQYSGTDLCPEFVNPCREKFPGSEFFCRDFLEHDDSLKYDFLTCSGTFYARLDTPADQWQQFVTQMIQKMYACCHFGIAVNFLSTFCDPEHTKRHLHYQDPWTVTAWVVRDLSRFVELDWGGPLFEYVLRIYRPEYISRLYPDVEFDRYFRNIDRACPAAHPASAHPASAHPASGE